MRNILRRVPLFAQMTDLELDAVRVVLRPLRLSSREVVFRQGAPGGSMIVVVDGLLEVEVEQGRGEAQKVSEVREGEVVGEMSCIDPGPRSATVLSARDTLAYELTRDGLDELRQHAPSAAATVVGAVVRDVTRRLRETDVRLAEELLIHGPASGHAVAPPSSGAHRAYRPPVSPPGLPEVVGFSEGDVGVLRMIATTLDVAPGEVLCQEGAPGDACFFILSGEVEVVRRLGTGEATLAVLSREALVGQIALIDAGLRSATVRARGPVKALSLARPAYERLLFEGAPLGLRIQEQIAIAGIRQLRGALDWLARLTRKPSSSASIRLMGAVPVPLPERPPGPRPGDEERRQRAIAYVQAAIREWGLSLEDLQRLHHAATQPPLEAESSPRE